MSEQDKFKVRFCSDLDYEELVADICYENETVAIITQENGVNSMQINIFPPEKVSFWSFSLDDFIETALFAKKRLIEMQKLPE